MQELWIITKNCTIKIKLKLLRKIKNVFNVVNVLYFDKLFSI